MKFDWVIGNIIGLVLGVIVGIAFILYLYSVFVLGAPHGF